MQIREFVKAMYACGPPASPSNVSAAAKSTSGAVAPDGSKVAAPAEAAIIVEGSHVKVNAGTGVNCSHFHREGSPYIFSNVQRDARDKYTKELTRWQPLHTSFPLGPGGNASLIPAPDGGMPPFADSVAGSQARIDSDQSGGQAGKAVPSKNGGRPAPNRRNGDNGKHGPIVSTLETEPTMQLYIGVAGSGASPHFHFDAYNVLVWGQKEWYVTPPALAEASSMSAADYVAHVLPSLPREQRPLMCTQEAGDIVFVPWGWGHAVLNTQTVVGYAIEGRSAFDRYR